MLFNAHIFTLLLAVIAFFVGALALMILTAWGMVLVAFVHRLKLLNAVQPTQRVTRRSTFRWEFEADPSASFSHED